MICPACQGDGKRLNPALRVVETAAGVRVVNPHGLPLLVPCTECIGGVASCCDGAGSAQPERQGR
jgi:hypothetical protein